VILVAPTGSGKMWIIYIAIKVKEMLLGRNIVTIGSEPTQNIIKEKLKSSPLPSASIGMKGNIDMSSETEITFSCPKKQLISGKPLKTFNFNYYIK
jgi:hypothetical protein